MASNSTDAMKSLDFQWIATICFIKLQPTTATTTTTPIHSCYYYYYYHTLSIERNNKSVVNVHTKTFTLGFWAHAHTHIHMRVCAHVRTQNSQFKWKQSDECKQHWTLILLCSKCQRGEKWHEKKRKRW